MTPRKENIKAVKLEPEIIGQAYEDLKELVKKYAIEDKPVLFVGETGSGKELFAKLFMTTSNRKGKKITINCASFSDELLYAEIFGHTKGAFTGATKERDGKIKACNDGVLFLDELGDASYKLQAAVLRVSEGNSYCPVGSDQEKEVNTLIIAATSKAKNVREDLKMRFHVLQIPPLQKSDIPVLAEYFCRRIPNKEVLDELLSCEYG